MALPRFNPAPINKPGVHATGERNLYLHVSSAGNGSKSWQFRYSRDSRTRAIGLGPLHAIDFAEAARLAHKLRGWLLAGHDPRAMLEAERTPAVTVPTFAEAAEAYIAANEPAWSNPKHRAQWRATLKTYVSPHIGSVPVDRITTEQVLRCLTPIWTTKRETASRVRMRIEAVLSYAKAMKYRDGENPARWTDHLEHVLPALGKAQRVRHHPSLPWQRLPAFMAALRQHRGTGAKALQLLILTACRSGEVRGARWPEFDMDNAIWTIPAARMKGKREHTVPLSAPALELLSSLDKHATTDLVFPSNRATPISDMAISMLLRGMNATPTWLDDAGVAVVPHGFRSTFRIWAGECSNAPRDVCEHALAHSLPDRVEAAYQRSTLYARRVRLMEEWAAWATSDPAVVVPLRGAA